MKAHLLVLLCCIGFLSGCTTYGNYACGSCVSYACDDCYSSCTTCPTVTTVQYYSTCNSCVTENYGCGNNYYCN